MTLASATHSETAARVSIIDSVTSRSLGAEAICFAVAFASFSIVALLSTLVASKVNLGRSMVNKCKRLPRSSVHEKSKPIIATHCSCKNTSGILGLSLLCRSLSNRVSRNDGLP